MIKVGLVDDQVYDLEKLQLILGKQEDVEIVFATTKSEEAYELLKKDEIDLLVSDIEMPSLSGYELADFINTYGLDVKVIFVTGYSAYAVHAFELDVLDYILKPYSKERLIKGIGRFEQKQTEVTSSEKLMLKQQSEIHMINKKDIVFIERTGRSTTIVTLAQELETYQSLVQLEKQLNKQYFIRSHKGFIINVQYIKNFTIYSKHSYLVHFQQTNKTAMITKANLETYQQQFY
ncbi:LytR/AlgR family response regulator transcription factor [Aquibacillus kalidii]|uniref:LytR/AlgR family response regulator transcription factor n=1 Tax=Aquibacillus kalidii TaxID=2762597 RepID=UPI0016441B58|nr:LytTR family DNA-binding domain-containing protein [Aquibacillus kalidii]